MIVKSTGFQSRHVGLSPGYHYQLSDLWEVGENNILVSVFFKKKKRHPMSVSMSWKDESIMRQYGLLVMYHVFGAIV